ncbi:adenylate cyclase type 2-like [Oppia nitens]|uniref:adenylate cyclase type 2-like n=1 Tax=Oppia nitens TaxID=1686743 RepID=UPI0023D9921A|nr:adenylate cyclase type 2-like [Oppia nitens]
MSFLLEIAIRKAFINHRSCIESTFKLDLEREQQEQLLNSCFPKHLIDDVRNDIRTTISQIARQELIPMRPFNKLYVKKYENVSILYADIVNSMILTASLSANDLVETLNELFGRFDESAERNHCLRIKLLGDCYYCVSGLPDYDPNHAINCVQMGLEMIRIIRTIRDIKEIDIDMRIGVHSGMVLSGIMGLHKWQYDIWSLDSVIASSMEHNGVPGFVHITQTTLDLISVRQRDDFIIKEKLTDGEIGYLISKKDVISHNRTNSGSPNSKRKRQTDNLKAQINKLRRRSYEPTHTRLPTTILESSLIRYREMINSVNKFMDSAIEGMPLNMKSQWCRPQDIHPFFLNFTSGLVGNKSVYEKKKSTIIKTEKVFAQQSDQFFSVYLLCAGWLCLTMMAIKFIIPHTSVNSEHKYCFVFTLIVIVVSLVYTFYRSHQLPILLRIGIWFLISSSLLINAVLDIIIRHCDRHLNETDVTFDELIKLESCAYSWDYTMCVILAMTGVSLFLRIHLWLKFLMHCLGVIIFIIIFYNKCSIYQILIVRSEEENLWISSIGFDPLVGHIYYVIMVAVLLHVIDRQIEYIFRLDFKWTNRLVDEKIEMQTMGEINRILLENILPIHVAQRYLYNSSVSADQLYSESYDSCAVMFASIPNYSQFYSENYESGLKCLQLLNEIILNFDQMLSHVNFQRVEKIKTIGSTYMAATGLQPGRGSNESEISIEDVRNNVITLVRFSTALMETLKKLNKDALQDFMLRVGIAVGPLIAGVVGAAKPQYDIWGDTVNVSSRMESTGIMGRIQVTEEAANVLIECQNNSEFVLEERGMVFVKGKGDLNTFLVKTQFDFDEHEITRV